MIGLANAWLKAFLGITPPSRATLESQLYRAQLRLLRLDDYIADLSLAREDLDRRCEELDEQLRDWE